MKKYEVILILNDQKVENAESFAASFAETVAKLGGKIENSKVMGRRTFARPIGKKNAGTYVNLEIQLDTDKVEELKDHYRLDNQVLRLEIYVFDRPEVTVIKKEKENAAS